MFALPPGPTYFHTFQSLMFVLMAYHEKCSLSVVCSISWKSGLVATLGSKLSW